jgi:hypothetical protein
VECGNSHPSSPHQQSWWGPRSQKREGWGIQCFEVENENKYGKRGPSAPFRTLLNRFELLSFRLTFLFSSSPLPPPPPPGVSCGELVLFQSIGGDMCHQRRHSNELAAKVVKTYWLRVKMTDCAMRFVDVFIAKRLRPKTSFGTTCGARRLAARDERWPDFALCDRFPPTLSIATLGNWNAKSISFRFMEMSQFGA